MHDEKNEKYSMIKWPVYFLNKYMDVLTMVVVLQTVYIYVISKHLY